MPGIELFSCQQWRDKIKDQTYVAYCVADKTLVVLAMLICLLTLY